MKNLPLSYNRDMQEDKVFIFSSVDFSEKSLAILTLIVDGLVPNEGQMRKDCFKGQITATDLADYLVERKMPFREAHEVVGKIVSLAEKKGVQIFELELEEFQEYSKLIKKDVLNYLDPSKTVLTRTQHGGTSPSQVKKAINKAMKKLRKGNV